MKKNIIVLDVIIAIIGVVGIGLWLRILYGIGGFYALGLLALALAWTAIDVAWGVHHTYDDPDEVIVVHHYYEDED